MTNLRHSFETGKSAGATIIAADTAIGGNQFDTVTGSPTYTSTAYRGALAADFQTVTSTAVSCNWTTSIGAALARSQGRMVVKSPTIAAIVPVFRARGASVQNFRVVIDGSGFVSIRNTASTTVVASVGQMSTSSVWLLRWDCNIGSSAAGVLYIHTDPTSATPTETLPFSAANLGSNNTDEANFGVASAISGAHVILDDIVFTDTGVPGPPAQSIIVAQTTTLGDAAAAAKAYARAAAEASTITDSPTRGFAVVRTLSEALALADAVAQSTAVARTGAETVTVGDSATRATAQRRTVGEATTTTDSTTTRVALGGVLAEHVTLADAAGRALAVCLPVADSVQLADAATAARAFARAAGETVTLTDSADLTSQSAAPLVAGRGQPRPVLRTAPLLLPRPGSVLVPRPEVQNR